jgi:hypothetical protein
MREASDQWFIRFPDGRVVRAVNTTIVRQHLGAGRIPRASAVRRSPEDEWTALEWTREFSDLLAVLPPSPVGGPAPAAAETPPSGTETPPPAAESEELTSVSSRLDPTSFRTVGVRGMTHELLAALDAALVRNKLAAAALAGVACGVVLALAQLPLLASEAGVYWPRWVLAGALLFGVLTVLSGLLTNLTYIEVSRLRRARWREGRAGLGRLTLRLALAWLLTAGAAGGLIVLLRCLPGVLLDQAPPGPAADGAAAAAAAVGLVLEVVLWPVFGFALLLPPILVVERCPVGRALGHWLRLLRQDLGRVIVYQALALGLGAAAALLLALPLAAVCALPVDPRVAAAAGFTRWVLAGLAAAPLLAYLAAANMFIYLNLRYESGRRR